MDDMVTLKYPVALSQLIRSKVCKESGVDWYYGRAPGSQWRGPGFKSRWNAMLCN